MVVVPVLVLVLVLVVVVVVVVVLVVVLIVVMSKWMFENILVIRNTTRKQVRRSSSTRPPAASRGRHVPPTQPYDVPANEQVPCPTRRAGSVATARIICMNPTHRP